MSSSEKLIRIYKKFYIDEIKAHLLTYGALSGTCAQCQCMEIKSDTTHCPKCGTEFKFIAFMHMKDHMPKVAHIQAQRPHVIFVDYDDFKRIEGEEKARNILS